MTFYTLTPTTVIMTAMMMIVMTAAMVTAMMTATVAVIVRATVAAMMTATVTVMMAAMVTVNPMINHLPRHIDRHPFPRTIPLILHP
jgi:hypothetical protein